MRSLILYGMLLISALVGAQGVVPSGGRSMSMGNASVTFQDVWAYHNNPGALGYVENLSAGLSYENRFLLKELQSQSLAVAIPLKVGVISLGGQSYGYNRYRTFKGGVGYSLKLAEMISAGVQLNYLGLQLPEAYGSKHSVSAEAGLLAKFSEKWSMGFSVFNLTRSKLAEYGDDRYSTIMRLGTAFQFSKKFLWSLEVDKDLEYDLRARSGVEYFIVDQLCIRGGVATSPLEVSFGIGYHPGNFKIDFGTAYRQILGWSPHFSLSYDLKK